MSITHLSNSKSIRSFVLRNSKLTINQKNLLEQLMPIWSIPYLNQFVDLNKIFGNINPIILDIGFGVGNTTFEMAKNYSNFNFVAVDVYSLGVVNLLKLIDKSNICNIRIIQYDAVDVVNNMLQKNSLYGVHIFFPDPWPKKRHHKRRLIQVDFIDKLSYLLSVGGYIHIATDWQNYALHILDLLNNCKYLVNKFEEFSTKQNIRSVTKFELKGKLQNHRIWDLVFQKKQIL